MLLVLGIATLMALPASPVAGLSVNASPVVYCEDFASDVFDGSLAHFLLATDWNRSSTTGVRVQQGELQTVLNMGRPNDWAEKNTSFLLPVMLEAKVRLVGGGYHYLTPYVGLNVNGTLVVAVYLPPDNYFNAGWGFGNPQDSASFWSGHNTSHKPPAENHTVTIRAIIREDGGKLYAMNETDNNFSGDPVAARNWSSPSSPVKIHVEQPWNADTRTDYVFAVAYLPGMESLPPLGQACEVGESQGL